MDEKKHTSEGGGIARGRHCAAHYGQFFCTLDLGTFVLDAGGQRWAMDLGSDDYNLPGYFGRGRFTYYRTSTAGHSTLRMNGRNQDVKAAAPLTAFGTKADGGFAIANLSAAYVPAGAAWVGWGVALINDRKQALI